MQQDTLDIFVIGFSTRAVSAVAIERYYGKLCDGSFQDDVVHYLSTPLLGNAFFVLVIVMAIFSIIAVEVCMHTRAHARTCTRKHARTYESAGTSALMHTQNADFPRF